MHKDAVCEKDTSGEEDDNDEVTGYNGKPMQFVIAMPSSKMLYPCLNIALGFWPQQVGARRKVR